MPKTCLKNSFGQALIASWLLLALGACTSERWAWMDRQFSPAKPQVILCCRADNDLFRVMKDNGIRCMRYDTPTGTIEKAPVNAGVLILADRYPDEPTPINPSLLDKAATKRLRLYVEYPQKLPGIELGEPRSTQWERAVVSSDFFGPALQRLRILCIHDCRFMPAETINPHLVFARVAGYDSAIFGLPEQRFPILFEHPAGSLLVATTKLSQFVTGRYGPTDAWQSIWHSILCWLCPQTTWPTLAWKSTVYPTYGRHAELPSDVERAALRRGIDWYLRAGQLIDCSQLRQIEGSIDQDARCVPAQPDAAIGDGTCGLLEGLCSKIDYQGRQPVRFVRRDDCICESAMTFAFGRAVGHGSSDSGVSANLLDFIYYKSPIAQGPRNDPQSPSYGLLGWTTHLPSLNVYYGDGGARSMLGTMAAAALLKSKRWDERLLRCLLANFRTAGQYGFRGNRLDEKGLQKHGWRYFHDREIVNLDPHYECYLWACYLWAYHQTGYEPFLDRATTAIRITMEAYPERWRWVNSFSLERARMLLPLAWLVRVEDTPEHRAWLKRMATDLLAAQVACGAIRDEVGDPKMGRHRPPESNEQYGTNESTLLQENGDPVCDLLYTCNFAFLGLHEAAAATRDPFYKEAEDKLAEFLCRVQVRSEKHPELDGAWYRAFDYKKWDYWASNSDFGWGAWCVETGWSQSWITSVLAMREMKTSFWDLTVDSKIAEHFDPLRDVMLADQ